MCREFFDFLFGFLLRHEICFSRIKVAGESITDSGTPVIPGVPALETEEQHLLYVS